jgi:hypothetical protein
MENLMEDFMSSEMKFLDAGKKMEGPALAEPPQKVYPRFSVDLEQFPGLKADVDESVELHLKGRICSVEHSDYCHRMDVEVQSIAVPTHTHDSVGAMNEADRAMSKLKRGY